MHVLGIETSCDETACAIVTDTGTILANTIYSQIDEHQKYAGVVPENAARAHILKIDNIVKQTLAAANCSLDTISGFAATTGPGLAGGLIVGSSYAKGLAIGCEKPFIAVNHLEGHALTPQLSHQVPFPYLLLLASGGHCLIVIVHGLGNYEELGRTIDDAAGEAFDKVAKMLNLGFPGGPCVEKIAQNGNPAAYTFPRPYLHKPVLDLSFAGLKTAVLRVVEQTQDVISAEEKANICASFQQAIADCLCQRMNRAAQLFRTQYPDIGAMVVAGGVAANQFLRQQLATVAENNALPFIAPPMHLCTDNAAMIAYAGALRLAYGEQSPLNTPVKPRWPLREMDFPKNYTVSQ